MLQVSFDIPNRQYRGHVTTDLEILSSSQHICVNTSNLELSNITLEATPGQKPPVNCVGLEQNSSMGVARLDFGISLPAGKYKLRTNFSGKIRNGLQGVYVNKFVDENGHEQDGVATMFAATEARSFFPCWDQPDVKCSFELSVLLQRDEKLKVLSNMNVIKNSGSDEQINEFVKGDEKWCLYQFSKSPLMSTYLLCIVIGQYSSLSKQIGDTKISIYAPLNRAEEATFSLDTAVKCIRILLCILLNVMHY